MRSRGKLLPRWYSSLGDINLVVSSLEALLPDYPAPQGRDRPPKHPVKQYAILIAAKELKPCSLRTTETDWSMLICGETIDHSVIHYWEQNIDVAYLEQAVRIIGKKLQEILGYEFSVIDATAFSNWHQRNTGFHLLNRIAEGTVYPVSMSPDTFNPIPNTRDTLVPGEGFLMGDKWYDVNGVYRIVYRNGYTPLIKPQRSRGSGHWRRKARKVFDREWRRYRHRGRGESPFGSLTNAFGDRLNTRGRRTTYVRSAARVVAYQVKIYIRATASGILIRVIVRHARCR